MRKLTRTEVNKFRRTVYSEAGKCTRTFPWRETNDPYKITVSELMLQQTQAERVVPKYVSFIKKFPTWQALAGTPLSAVLQEWQGLGYNRRAKYVHELAKTVVQHFNSRLPQEEDLVKLPGIGPATAAAIQAFALNAPSLYLETNVRSVFLYYFFKDKTSIPDSSIVPLIAQTLDRANPRLWYTALLDYGACLKKTVTNPSRASKHYSKQTPFKGSQRELRGKAIKLLLQEPLPLLKLVRQLGCGTAAARGLLQQLVAEGLVQKHPGKEYYYI